MKLLVLSLITLSLTACGSRTVSIDARPALNGTNGSSCSVQSLATGALISCTDGTGSLISNGTNGTNGTDATPVSIIPLCPGTTNYGTFVEIGVCLAGKLYGVYSANGGFLTYFADGNYNSNAINSSCNLTINGCIVSH